MTKMLEIGPVRLAVLGADGITKLKTLILPPPNADGGLKLVWESTGVFDYVLEAGGKGTRVIERPHIPRLTLTWAPYDDRPEAWDLPPIGTNHGQRPSWQQLVELTAAPYWGFLRISPGMTAGGFTVSKVDDQSYGLIGCTEWAESVELVFHGSEGSATKTLEEF